jgi:hypothetical protein
MEMGYVLYEVGTEFLCIYYFKFVLERVNHIQIWTVFMLEFKLLIYCTFLKVAAKGDVVNAWS